MCLSNTAAQGIHRWSSTISRPACYLCLVTVTWLLHICRLSRDKDIKGKGESIIYYDGNNSFYGNLLGKRLLILYQPGLSHRAPPAAREMKVTTDTPSTTSARWHLHMYHFQSKAHKKLTFNIQALLIEFISQYIFKLMPTNPKERKGQTMLKLLHNCIHLTR